MGTTTPPVKGSGTTPLPLWKGSKYPPAPEPEAVPVPVPVPVEPAQPQGPTAQERLESPFWQSAPGSLQIAQDQPLHRQINQHKKLINKLNKEIDKLAWPSALPEPEQLGLARQSVVQLNEFGTLHG